MQIIIEFLKSDTGVLIIPILIIMLIIIYVSNRIKLKNIQNKYNVFLNKILNGKNIEESLQKYMDKVNEVQKEQKQIKGEFDTINGNLEKCIQKVGIVRYTAFKDIGSDLSFALAMLDEKDNGVVLNGIFSRDMSNIYAKPIEKGESKYTLSEQEKQAIQKAVNNK